MRLHDRHMDHAMFLASESYSGSQFEQELSETTNAAIDESFVIARVIDRTDVPENAV